MFKKRINYIILVIFIIVVGITSRKISGIPFFVGDILYATMMYFLIRILFVEKTNFFVLIVSLIICFCIEISQIYQAQWINEIRQTILGRLILGQGFLFSDLIAYIAGVFFGMGIDILITKIKTIKNGKTPL